MKRLQSVASCDRIMRETFGREGCMAPREHLVESWSDIIIIRVLIVVIGVLIVVAAAFAGFHRGVLPRCEEDKVIVGVGSFEHGYWSEYQCAVGEPNALIPDGVEYLTRPAR